jgi:hypothetical protein
MSMNERIDDERKTKVERYLGRPCVRPPGIRSRGHQKQYA